VSREPDRAPSTFEKIEEEWQMRSTGSVLIICMAAVLLPVVALANGFYMPGVGSRANALGGAFVGLADDYSAVYWNPAGITQIKGMELTGSLQDAVTLASRDGSIYFDGSPGQEDGNRFAIATVGATSEGQTRLAPGLFFYMDPGPARALVDKVGLAVYTLSDYGVTWKGSDVLNQSDLAAPGGGFDLRILTANVPDSESRVKTYVISPVIAREILPGLSVGVTANIAYSHFLLKQVHFEQTSYFAEFPEPTPDEWWLILTPYQATDDATGWGYGATAGVLYRASSRLSVGVSARSPMTIKYDGTYGLKVEAAEEEFKEKYKEDFEIRYPLWVGGGIAYRDFLADGLTITADVDWTRWSNIQRIARTVDWPEGTEDELLSALEVTRMNWEDTFEYSVGLDYRVGRSTNIGLGFKHSPSPVPNSSYNFVLPSTTSNTIAFGVNYKQDFWRFAASLEYVAGDRRNVFGTADMNGSQLVDHLLPSASLTYAF
jgi:long-chain fatty acid transport protein